MPEDEPINDETVIVDNKLRGSVRDLPKRQRSSDGFSHGSSITRVRQTGYRGSLANESQLSSVAEMSVFSQKFVSEAVRRASRWVAPTDNEASGPGETQKPETKSAGPQAGGMFANADNIRSQMRNDMGKRDFDISDFYFKTGIPQAIARNPKWQTVTLVIIAINSLWIGLEIELNKEPNLTDADWPFQVGEYFFCAFFVFEWAARFFALEKKVNGLRDRWFVFDGILVFMMVAETLVLPHVMATASNDESVGEEDGEGGGGGGVGQFGMLRMLRLLRLTRMVRFMRSVPELVTLLKSLSLAGRPVMSTLLLLLCLLYTFGIIFKSQLQLTPESTLYKKFGRLRSSMLTLLYQGTLLDNIGKTANPLMEESPVITGLFIIFVLFSSFTVLNLLIGMVCEVVNVVALTEKEKAMVAYVKGKLMHVLEELDEDGNGTISKSEFDKLMEIPAAIQALQELGIDLPNLVSLSDHLFEDEDELDDGNKKKVKEEDELDDLIYMQKTSSLGMGSKQLKAEGKLPFSAEDIEREQLLQTQNQAVDLRFDDNVSRSGSGSESDEGKCLTFGDFIEMVIRLRPDSHPSVVDCVDLRKLYLKGQKQISNQVEHLEEMNAKLVTDIQRNICHHPLFIVICNHPEMQARMPIQRGSGTVPFSHVASGCSSAPYYPPTSSVPISRTVTDSVSGGMHCWSKPKLPELRRGLTGDDQSNLNRRNDALPRGLSNLQQLRLSHPLDEAGDDRSTSSRDRGDIPEEQADVRQRLKARGRYGTCARSGAASSSGDVLAEQPSSRRPSEGKLTRILAQIESTKSAPSKGDTLVSSSQLELLQQEWAGIVLPEQQAAGFSKEDRAWQLDEVFLKDNKTKQLDEAVLDRVLDATNAIWDEDEDWALDSAKAFFQRGREQTNTTGTGSASSSTVDVEGESFESRSQCVSIADEANVEIPEFGPRRLRPGSPLPMVQAPRALQSIFARHKASRGSEDDGLGNLSSRFFDVLQGRIRRRGSNGASVGLFSPEPCSSTSSRSQATTATDQARSRAGGEALDDHQTTDVQPAGADEAVPEGGPWDSVVPQLIPTPRETAPGIAEALTHEISEGCLSEVPQNAITHVSPVRPVDEVVDVMEYQDGPSGVISCAPSSFCCGQETPGMPLAAV